ncbi:MAG: hypothetical protein HQL56_01700 [Magnetococcales bacterium]|nr:hypothetical protein [Magnetococcales bacterium]
MSEEPAAPSVSWWKRPVRLLFRLLALVVLLIVLLLGGHSYLVEWAPVQGKLRAVLKANLPGEVDFSHISFNLFRGLALADGHWTGWKGLDLHFKELLLDYKAAALLGGKVQINRVELKGFRGGVDLEALRQPSTAQTEGPRTAASAPPPLPPLVLGELLAEVESFSLRLTSSRSIHLERLRLTSNLNATLKSLSGQATLQVASVGLVEGKRHLTTPLVMRFELQGSPKEGRIRLDSFFTQLGPALEVQGKGGVTRLENGALGVTAEVEQAALQLPEIRNLLDHWLPSLMSDAEFKGGLTLKGRVSGEIPPGGPASLVAGAELEAKAVAVHWPMVGLYLEPSQVGLRVEEMTTHADHRFGGRFEATGRIPALSMGGQRLQGGEFSLKGRLEPDGAGEASLHAGVESIIPDLTQGQLAPFPLQVDLQSRLSADHRRLEWHLSRLDSDKLLQMHSKGRLHRVDGGTGWESSGEVQAKVVLKELLTRLASFIPGETPLRPEARKDTLSLSWQAGLDERFQPVSGDAEAHLQVASLPLDARTSGWNGKVETLSADVQAHLQDSRIKADTRIGLDLTGLRQGADPVLKRARLTVQGSGTGTWDAATGRPVADQVNQRLEMEVEGLHLRQQEVATDLDRLTLRAAGTAWPETRRFQWERLNLEAPSLLQVESRGEVQGDSGKVDGSLEIKAGDLAKLNKAVRLKVLEEREIGDFAGRLALRLQTKGRLPSEEELAKTTLPMTASLSLQGEGLAGRMGNLSFKGVHPDMRFGYTPGVGEGLDWNGKVKAARLQLPGEMVLQEVTGDWGIALKGGRLLQVDHLKAAFPGVDFQLEGRTEGFDAVRQARGEEALTAALRRLFATLHSRLFIDLERMSAMLARPDVQGRGQLALELGLTKEEKKQQFASRLEMDFKKVDLTAPGLRLQGLDGEVDLRKNLRFAREESRGKTAVSHLVPTDLLPELLGTGKEGRVIRIKSLQSGAWKLDDIHAYLDFQQETLRLQQLGLNLLGGNVGGDLQLVTGKEPLLRFRLEGVNLDVATLTGVKSTSAEGGSQVDLLLNGVIPLSSGEEPLVLERAEMNVVAPRIGRRAVVDLLRFLDPEDRNPALVDARSKVNLANPSRLEVRFRHGVVSLRIDFQEGVLDALRMERIPVRGLAKLKGMQPVLEPLRGLVAVLQRIGSDSLAGEEKSP